MARGGTRGSIIQAGIELFLDAGFNRTGIQAIVNHSDVPKGSFYTYFKSKEEFAIEVIEAYTAQFDQLCEEILDDVSRPPIERLKRYFTTLRDTFSRQSFRRGCLLGNLTLEMADQSVPIMLKLRSSFDRLEGHIQHCLDEAIEAGELPGGADTKRLAAFCIDAWEGAILRMKVKKSSAPLELFTEMFFSKLLGISPQ